MGYDQNGFTDEDRRALRELARRRDHGSFTPEDRERLVALEVQLASLGQQFETYLTVAVGEVGFPRCAVRKEKIDKIENSLMWLRRTFYGGVILAAISLFTEHHEKVWDFIVK